jgi:CPA2 family monovalent cation:H+ antiporter-2
VGLSTNSIGNDLYSLILTVAIATMMLTPLVSGQTARIYALKKRWFRHEVLQSSNIPDTGFSGHVVIAGGGRVGFQIAQALKRLNMQFVIIEIDQRRFEQAKVGGMAVVYGDAGQEIVLEAAGIEDASLLILTLPALAEARSVIVHSKHLNSRLKIIARTQGPDSFELLRNLGVSQVVLPEFEAGLEMTRQSLLYLGVPPTEVHRCTDTVRQEIYAHLVEQTEDYLVLSQLRNAEQEFDLQWVRLDRESPITHRSIGESEIRKRTGASVVGVVRGKQLTPNPDAEFVLLPDDLVAIIGSERNRKAVLLMASSIT